MPELPELALAREILYAYYNDDFLLVIIYGTQRIGKSCYASRAMAQALEFIYGINFWELNDEGIPTHALKYMGWDPVRVSDTWLNLKKKIPCYHWDDAGYWLFSLNWNDPILISIQKYMNVVGTDIACLMLSTPDPRWILSKIATNPGMVRVRIIKKYGTKKYLNPPPSVKFARLAKGYKPYRSPDLKKHGVNVYLDDDFSCKFPDQFYGWYKPTRDFYARAAKQAIRDNLEKSLNKGGEKRGRPRKGKKDSDEDTS